MAEETARHPVLLAKDDDAPARRHREPSASIGAATAGLVEALVGDALDDRVRAALPGALANFVDATAENAAAAPGPRASLPWAVALTAILVALIGAVGVTFDKLSQLERRTTEAEQYDRAMAQWLVVSNTNSHETMKGIDTMLRGIAVTVGAGATVDKVAKPVKTEPPPGVAMKALEAQAR